MKTMLAFALILTASAAQAQNSLSASCVQTIVANEASIRIQAQTVLNDIDLYKTMQEDIGNVNAIGEANISGPTKHAEVDAGVLKGALESIRSGKVSAQEAEVLAKVCAAGLNVETAVYGSDAQ